MISPTARTAPYTKVIGRPPPGIGNSPDVIFLGQPSFTRNVDDFDTMEETLWVSNLITTASIDTGADRTAPRSLAAEAVFRAQGFRQTGRKAGKAVIVLTSKGWLNPKGSYYSWRRNTQGDMDQMTLGGFAYITVTTFLTTQAMLTYSAKIIPSERFGLINSVISPTYMSTWPYYFSGAGPGWFITARSWDPLPGLDSHGKRTTTFACLMNKDGTAPT